MHGRRPNPRIVLFAQHAQSDAVFGEELHGLIATGHRNELAVRKVRSAQRIESEGTLLADTLAAERKERYRLVPIGDAEHIRVTNADWIDGNGVDWRITATGSFDFALLFSGLIPNGNCSICQAQRQILTINGPCAAIDTRHDFEFLHGLLFDGPKCEIRLGARQQLVRDRIECHTLHRIVVAAKLYECGVKNISNPTDRRSATATTHVYFNSPSNVFVQTMTHLSAPPEANFLPSFAYATQYMVSLCPGRLSMSAPSFGSYTSTLSQAPTINCVPSGLKQIE